MLLQCVSSILVGMNLSFSSMHTYRQLLTPVILVFGLNKKPRMHYAQPCATGNVRVGQPSSEGDIDDPAHSVPYVGVSFCLLLHESKKFCHARHKL